MSIKPKNSLDFYQLRSMYLDWKPLVGARGKEAREKKGEIAYRYKATDSYLNQFVYKIDRKDWANQLNDREYAYIRGEVDTPYPENNHKVEPVVVQEEEPTEIVSMLALLKSIDEGIKKLVGVWCPKE